MASQTAYYFYNNSGEVIPAYAVIQITGATRDAKGFIIHTAVKPTNDGKDKVYYINDELAIPAGGTGYCYAARETTWALYGNTSGTPQNGEEWGPQTGSWELGPRGKGFIIIGLVESGRVQCQTYKFYNPTGDPSDDDYDPSLSEGVDPSSTAGEECCVFEYTDIGDDGCCPEGYTRVSKQKMQSFLQDTLGLTDDECQDCPETSDAIPSDDPSECGEECDATCLRLNPNMFTNTCPDVVDEVSNECCDDIKKTLTVVMESTCADIDDETFNIVWSEVDGNWYYTGTLNTSCGDYSGGFLACVDTGGGVYDWEWSPGVFDHGAVACGGVDGPSVYSPLTSSCDPFEYTFDVDYTFDGTCPGGVDCCSNPGTITITFRITEPA